MESNFERRADRINIQQTIFSYFYRKEHQTKALYKGINFNFIKTFLALCEQTYKTKKDFV